MSRLRAVRAAVPGLVVLSVLAGLLFVRGHRRLPMALLGVAAVLVTVALAFPGPFLRFQRWLLHAAGVLGGAVLTGCLAVFGAVVLIPVWALNRLVGARALDDGWATSTGTTAWRTRTHGRSPEGQAPAPFRMAAPEHLSGPGAKRSSRRRKGVVGAGVAAVLLLLTAIGAAPWSPEDPVPVADRGFDGGVVGGRDSDVASSSVADDERVVSDDDPSDEVDGEPEPVMPPDLGESPVMPGAEDLQVVGLPVTTYAHEDEPWFPQHIRETNELRTTYDPAIANRYGDVDGETISIVDGRRRSYQPPDPELTVWYFGGSTMFGLGQRDEHTIPSEVARLAEDDGISVRSVNFGAMSVVNWSETIAFAEALETMERPDLVVFYDGGNEVGNAFERYDLGQRDPDRSIRSLVSDEERRLLTQPADDLPIEERDALIAELAGAQYGRGVRMGRVLAEGYGVPVVHFWQPSFDTKRTSAADGELLRRLGLEPRPIGSRSTLPAKALENADVDVIDVSDALDDLEVPVLWDWAHTNELGARTIAAALYEHLEPQMRQLLADR